MNNHKESEMFFPNCFINLEDLRRMINANKSPSPEKILIVINFGKKEKKYMSCKLKKNLILMFAIFNRHRLWLEHGFGAVHHYAAENPEN